MKQIIEKYGIDVTAEGLQKMSNEDLFRLKCLQDDQVFYGYKKSEFFDDPLIKDNNSFVKAH